MGKVQKPSNSVCYTPSSEPFRTIALESIFLLLTDVNIYENVKNLVIPKNDTGMTKLNSVAFSPQANYTDRATAACWRS
jgi:hypothetical protein